MPGHAVSAIVDAVCPGYRPAGVFGAASGVVN
jgi:hypothetical protein